MQGNDSEIYAFAFDNEHERVLWFTGFLQRKGTGDDAVDNPITLFPVKASWEAMKHFTANEGEIFPEVGAFDNLGFAEIIIAQRDSSLTNAWREDNHFMQRL